MMATGKRAVFFDRDGVLNEEVGYVGSVGRLRIIPSAIDAVRRVNAAGWLAIVVTNQAGVARGYFTEDDVRTVHRELERRFAAGGARFDAFYYCPHHPEHGEPPYRVACECRKPAPGMLKSAARDFGISLESSYLITDRAMEIGMAHRVGMPAILVLTGYGESERAAIEAARAPERASRGLPPDGAAGALPLAEPEHIAAEVLEAVEWALAADSAPPGRLAGARPGVPTRPPAGPQDENWNEKPSSKQSKARP
jgi:D-glycero-D-manno-heptose 1,7-bisphosphate phosphatase